MYRFMGHTKLAAFSINITRKPLKLKQISKSSAEAETPLRSLGYGISESDDFQLHFA